MKDFDDPKKGFIRDNEKLHVDIVEGDVVSERNVSAKDNYCEIFAHVAVKELQDYVIDLKHAGVNKRPEQHI